MTLIPPDKTKWHPPQPEQPPEAPQTSRHTSVAVWIGLALIVTVLVLALVSSQSKSESTSITYSAFLTKVAAGDVKSVDINQSSGQINGRLRDNTAFTTQGATGGMPASDVTLLDQHQVQRNYVAPSSSLWPGILSWIFVFGLIGLIMFWFLRRSQSQVSSLTGWSRSRAKVHITEKPSTTFQDVAGYTTVKQELGEVVDFLRNPDRYSSIGAHIPKGVLLVGPPGTGKTLLARAVAGEAGVPFITITGSEFMEMFVGVGAARVRDLFAQARSHTPSIVFIDEIDAIGRKRGTGLGGGHDEREQTLNQLLAEMDGFEVTEGIVMMAATNRPDILDPALLRAGRFDRQVVVPLPTLEERLAILRVHCRGKSIGPDVDLETAAKGTPGMSGADLDNLVNEAALIAVRREASKVEQVDIEAARDRVLLGMQRDALALTPEEKRIVAYHEAGHAVLAELLPHSDPVHKVTILPTGMALGATQQLPAEERHLQQRPYLDDALAVRLGGRAAEEVVFGVPSTGAQDDLTAATELAGRMVREWGMSAHIGPMAWGSRGPVFLGEELVHTRDYSDETARVIDEEVAGILAEQKERACRILTDNREALDAVAEQLDLLETLDGARVRRIIRERNGGGSRQLSPLQSKAGTSCSSCPDGAALLSVPEVQSDDDP